MGPRGGGGGRAGVCVWGGGVLGGDLSDADDADDGAGGVAARGGVEQHLEEGGGVERGGGSRCGGGWKAHGALEAH